MRGIGKLVGGILGFIFSGFFGALAGLFAGHIVDRWRDRAPPDATLAHKIQEVFFRATFMAMGHVCKSDGQVTRAEIKVAERIMERMALSPEQRREAIGYFNAGKDTGFDLDATLDEFRRLCRWQPNLFRFFFEVQLQAALADGQVEPAERETLLRIARRLGLSRTDYARIESLLRGEQHQRAAAGSSEQSLSASYEILGVSSSASDGEVKRAYRRLMSQHHPDKLASRGLPEEMMQLAKEKTQEIRGAYDAIRSVRDMK
ncbi:MAG: co-chaperone DjlA [Pseudomonadota bacterium]|nr:co-chaperone DjlA [Pseudomonadota bacterium]